MGKMDHKQINEQVEVRVWLSLDFWPPGIDEDTVVGSMATFFQGSRATLFNEAKKRQVSSP